MERARSLTWSPVWWGRVMAAIGGLQLQVVEESAGVADGLARDPGRIDEGAQPGLLGQRIHPSVAHDGLREAVVHGMDPRAGDAPLDRRRLVPQGAEDLGVDV